MNWPVAELCAALEAPQIRGTLVEASGLEIDTRRLRPGEIFLAFRGAQVDGHDFLDHAAAQGAAYALVEVFQDHGLPQVLVADMRTALRRLARHARRHQDAARFVAITGSVGKTSTRRLMHQGFSSLRAVYASRGNFNNDLGMPLCLAQMGCVPRWDVAIFELGMNAPREIAPLSDLLRPNLALVLNVAAVHQEYFADLAGIACAKAEIFSGLVAGGLALLPHQAEFSEIFQHGVPDSAQSIVYNAPDARFFWQDDGLYDRSSGGFLLGDKGQFRRFRDNLCAVFASYATLFPDAPHDLSRLGGVLSDWQPESGRGGCSRLTLYSGAQVTVFDDSYNASLPSMQAMFADLAAKSTPSSGGRKVVVLGDMKELGVASLALHQKVICSLNDYGFDAVFVVGETFAALSENIERLVHVAPSASECSDALGNYLESGDIVAFKASRSVGLEVVIHQLVHRHF